MSRTIPKPDQAIVDLLVTGTTRIAEEEFGLDVTKENVIRFIRHQAYVKAQMDAEITWLRGILNKELNQ